MAVSINFFSITPNRGILYLLTMSLAQNIRIHQISVTRAYFLFVRRVPDPPSPNQKKRNLKKNVSLFHLWRPEWERINETRLKNPKQKPNTKEAHSQRRRRHAFQLRLDALRQSELFPLPRTCFAANASPLETELRRCDKEAHKDQARLGISVHYGDQIN